MKRYLQQWGWAYGMAAVLLGLLATVAIGQDATKQDALPAYLQSAKYITSAKCRMCHKPIAVTWEQTKHAACKDQFPWEVAKTAQPAPDVVYRYVTGPDADVKTWAEKGTACEACHGPGSAHMPAKKELRASLISVPTKLDTPGKKLSLCGRCHGQYTVGGKRYAANFLPGQDLTKMDGFKLDAVEPGKPMQQMNELMQSKHFTKDITCVTCHSSHEGTADHMLRKPVVAQCTECHKDKTLATHAPKAPEGATCATCHMPKGMHTFKVPEKD